MDFYWPTRALQIVLTKAKEAWDVFGCSNKRKRTQTLIGWSRPPVDYVKINVDGSAIASPGLSTAGGILRDSEANWLSGFQYRVFYSHILTAELWAIYHGLSLCWEKVFAKLFLSQTLLFWQSRRSTAVSHKEINISLCDQIWLNTSFMEFKKANKP